MSGMIMEFEVLLISFIIDLEDIINSIIFNNKKSKIGRFFYKWLMNLLLDLQMKKIIQKL